VSRRRFEAGRRRNTRSLERNTAAPNKKKERVTLSSLSSSKSLSGIDSILDQTKREKRNPSSASGRKRKTLESEREQPKREEETDDYSRRAVLAS